MLKEKGLVYGASIGTIYIFIIYIINLGVFAGPFMSTTILIYAAITILFAMLGGIMGVNM